MNPQQYPMLVDIKDCKVYRETGWNTILHVPTDLCVSCPDDRVTDAELFSVLIEDLRTRKDFNFDPKTHTIIHTPKDQAK